MSPNKVILDGTVLLIIGTIILMGFCIVCLYVGIKIGTNSEKIAAIEDIVFENGIYEKLKKEVK